MRIKSLKSKYFKRKQGQNFKTIRKIIFLRQANGSKIEKKNRL